MMFNPDIHHRCCNRLKNYGAIPQTKVTLVIPAKAGIQESQNNNICLDTRFHGYDVV